MGSSRGHPLFAAVYDRLIRGAERKFLGAHRDWLASRLTGRVLDVGCGTGLNFAHYPGAVEVVAVEPDPHMLRRARARAAALGRQIELLEAGAEDLPFPDGSFDTAVATLVLCTVTDLDRSLGEIRRVLRPGGALRFLEHVRSPRAGWARFQDAVTPIWRTIGAGCHPNRDTVAAVERAGFRVVELERYVKGPYPVRIFVRGAAVR
jgi:ubiquinone/menaquinone biosynthesis C-methylase UbiE